MYTRLLLTLTVMLMLASTTASAFAAGDGGSKAAQYALVAEEAYWSGDLETSITNYAQAHTLAPDNQDYLLAYVRVLIYGSYASRAHSVHAETALLSAQNFVVEYPDSAQGQAALALALTENGQSSEAITVAQQAIEFAPESAEAHAYLSLAYRGDNHWQQAQESAQTAVNLDDESIDAHRALALALAFTGEWAMTIDEYRIAISLHPMLDVLYFELAPYYIVQENFDSAETIYNTVIEHNPENAKAWTRRCELFFRERDDAQAIESCQEALRIDPNSSDALRLTGQVSYTMRDYEGAIDYFARCITTMNDQSIPVNDHYEQCYYLQGLALYFLARCDEAEELFTFALDNLDVTERGRDIISEGRSLCELS